MALLSPSIREGSFSWLPGYRLRPMERTDLPAFVEIGLPTCAFMHGRSDVPPHEMRRNFASFVQEFAFDGGSEIYLAEDVNGRIVGQIWLHSTNNRFNNIKEMWVWDLTVCEEFRRRGLGRALLRFAKVRASDLKCGELWLLVSSRNVQAVELYQSEGLRSAGHLMSLAIVDGAISQDLSVSLEMAELRRLSARDLNELYRTWDAAGLPYRRSGRDHPDRLTKFLRSETPGWAAFREGRMVGAVMTSNDGRKGWIERLAVRPDCRRVGIARVLVSAAVQTLRETGILVVAALIMEPNTASRTLFESCGFIFDPKVCYYSIRERPDD